MLILAILGVPFLVTALLYLTALIFYKRRALLQIIVFLYVSLTLIAPIFIAIHLDIYVSDPDLFAVIVGATFFFRLLELGPLGLAGAFKSIYLNATNSQQKTAQENETTRF